MKKIYLSLLCGAICTMASAEQPAVATFEDLNAEAETAWDGSDGAAMFMSGGYIFINNYTDWGGFGSWDGFAWSTMTSTLYESLDDQYNACTGSGVNGSKTFGVAYYSAYSGTEPTVISSEATAFEATGCYVTNSAYALTSMMMGDDYCKKFDETDWFLLTATGYLGDEITGTADFYLAKDCKMVNDWEYFDLSALGTVDEIHFTMSSSDTGLWGMNTPAYFCLDNFGEANNSVAINTIAQNAENKCYNLQGQLRSNSNGWTISNSKILYIK